MRVPGGKADQIGKRRLKVKFVTVAFHIAQVRRTQNIGQGQQLFLVKPGRFMIVNIHSRSTGSPVLQGLIQRSFTNESRPAGIHQQGIRFHQCQVSQGHTAAGLVIKTQLQGQNIGRGKKFSFARGNGKTIRQRPLPGRFPSPDQNIHPEGLTVAGDALADLTVAPDPQGQALQRSAKPEAAGILPPALLTVLHIGNDIAAGRHDQTPAQFRRSNRRPDSFGHGNPMGAAGLQVEMVTDLAGLADQLQIG